MSLELDDLYGELDVLEGMSVVGGCARSHKLYIQLSSNMDSELIDVPLLMRL